MPEQTRAMRKKKPVDRNYEISCDPAGFKGAEYIEIATGRLSGSKDMESSIYINKDSFLVIVGIIKKHYTKYDHYEMKNISRTTGRKIIRNFRETAESILSCKGPDILKPLEYNDDKSPKAVNDLVNRKSSISKMLLRMADYMENAYETNDWICVLDV